MAFKKIRTDLPLGLANTVEYLKDTALYANLKLVLEQLKTLEDIKLIDLEMIGLCYNNAYGYKTNITKKSKKTFTGSWILKKNDGSRW